MIRVASICLAALAVSSLSAGDLVPPGAPSSTSPSLSDLEVAVSSAETAALSAAATAEAARIAAVAAQDPRAVIPSLPWVIDQPGSYRLTQDLTGSPGSPGIVILADDVTLDLNGFALIGVAGSTNGIEIGEFLLFPTRIAIRNGAIHSWDGQGIEGDAAISWTLENLFVTDNGGTGIEIGRIGPSGGSAVDCHAADNGGNGFRLGWSSSLRGCTAQGNQSFGFRLGARSVASGCVADGNGNDGFLMDFVNQLNGCASAGNSGDGYGGLTDGNVVVNCTATGNTGDGIRTGSSSVVRGCTASRNNGNGIYVTRGALVEGNNCRENDMDSAGGGSGIVAANEENRIEGNSVSLNTVGILANATNSKDNLIIRNSAVSNGTNYTVDEVDNFVGTIQTTPVGAGPWDNFDL